MSNINRFYLWLSVGNVLGVVVSVATTVTGGNCIFPRITPVVEQRHLVLPKMPVIQYAGKPGIRCNFCHYWRCLWQWSIRLKNRKWHTRDVVTKFELKLFQLKSRWLAHGKALNGKQVNERRHIPNNRIDRFLLYLIKCYIFTKRLLESNKFLQKASPFLNWR